MATALANEQIAPASTTSRQSCSVTRQFRTWYITDPSVACNCSSIGIFWGNHRGSVARMVNKTLLEAVAEAAFVARYPEIPGTSSPPVSTLSEEPAKSFPIGL